MRTVLHIILACIFLYCFVTGHVIAGAVVALLFAFLFGHMAVAVMSICALYAVYAAQSDWWICAGTALCVVLSLRVRQLFSFV